MSDCVAESLVVSECDEAVGVFVAVSEQLASSDDYDGGTGECDGCADEWTDVGRLADVVDEKEVMPIT